MPTRLPEDPGRPSLPGYCFSRKGDRRQKEEESGSAAPAVFSLLPSVSCLLPPPFSLLFPFRCPKAARSCMLTGGVKGLPDLVGREIREHCAHRAFRDQALFR